MKEKIIKKYKCFCCEGRGVFTEERGDNIWFTGSCTYCKGTGYLDNEQINKIARRFLNHAVEVLTSLMKGEKK